MGSREQEFLKSNTVTIPLLKAFVKVIQPGAVLREKDWMNVQVGHYIAPNGGPQIEKSLEELIDDVEETLGANVLGVIPFADAKDIQERLKDRYPEGMDEDSLTKTINLVSHFAPKTMIAESFRSLRTNIQFKDVEKKLKTISVASTTLQEGKTMVAINLAITMAQGGMKVLLVGCDLRKPMVAKRLGLERTPGLTDILLGNYIWRDTVKGLTDIIENGIVGSDHPNPDSGRQANLHPLSRSLAIHNAR